MKKGKIHKKIEELTKKVSKKEYLKMVITVCEVFGEDSVNWDEVVKKIKQINEKRTNKSK